MLTVVERFVYVQNQDLIRFGMPLKEVMLLDLIYCSFSYLYCEKVFSFLSSSFVKFLSVVPVHIALHMKTSVHFL